MGLGLVERRLSHFAGWNHSPIGWHTPVRVKSRTKTRRSERHGQRL